MRQLFQRILNDHRWFIGFIIVLFFIFLFSWRIFDHQGFTNTINGFLQDLWEIVKSFIYMVIALAFMYLGVARIFSFGPFRKKKSSGGH